MKRLVVLLMVMVLGFSFGGCFKKKENAEPPKKPEKTQSEEAKKVTKEEKKEIPYSESKWGKLQEKYMDTGELFISGKKDGTENRWAAKGGMTYHTYKNENGEIEDIISNSTTQWWLYKNKTYEAYTFSEDDVKRQAENLETFYLWFPISSEEMDELTVKIGKKEYKGKTYDFEEISYQGGKDIFLYDDDGNPVIDIYEYGEETSVYENIQIKTKVEDSLFQVPDDYQAI